MSIPNTGNNETLYPDRGIRGMISDAAHRLLRLDASTHVISTIEYEHHEIHSGSSFFFEEGFQLNSSTREYLVETANSAKEPHMVINVSGSQDCRFEWIKNTDHTPGDEVEIQNRNERSSKTSETRIWRAPGGADGGQAKKRWSANYGVAAAGGGKGGSGGAAGGRHEEILARRSGQNTGKYVLRITALSQNDQNFTVSFDWYEHTPKY